MINYKTWGAPVERLLRGVEFDLNGGCWLWSGGCVGNGYGRIRIGNRSKALTHRISYEAFIGPIPPGMMVLHKCDIPACANPDHLFLGRAQDNVADMMRKGRHVVKPSAGEKHPMSRLTRVAVIDIRTSSELGRVLAERYGVSESTISRARHGTLWTSVPAASRRQKRGGGSIKSAGFDPRRSKKMNGTVGLTKAALREAMKES